MKAVDRRSCLLFLLTYGAALACNSPTLPPLPPPNEPRLVQHMGDGEVLLEGSIPVEEAKLLVLNNNNDEIRGVFTHDGTYSLLIAALPGDFIHLWYSTAGVDSPLARFTIPPLPEGLEAPQEGAGSGDEGAASESEAVSPCAATPADAGCTCP